MPRIADFLDECIPVDCRKCGAYLATVIPKAEVLCHSCTAKSKTKAPVWTQAVKPKSNTKNAQRKRLTRAKTKLPASLAA